MTCCCCLRPPNSSKCIQMWWLNLNLHDCWFDPSRNCKKIVENVWNQDASELWQKYVSSTCSSLFCFFGIFWSIRFTAELGKELEWWPTGRSWHANGQRATWKMSAPVGWWVCGSGGESLVLMLYGLYSLCVCVRFEKKSWWRVDFYLFLWALWDRGMWYCPAWFFCRLMFTMETATCRMVPPVCQSSCRLLLGDMDYAI